MGPHVLVTGAGGFVGRRIATVLAERGFAVCAVHRSGAPPDIADVSWVRADLAESGATAVLPERIDAIVHFAATSPGSGIDSARLVRDNLNGFDSLLSWGVAAGARRFIFASSMSLYGCVSGEVDETTPIVDPDVYGTTKWLGERILADRADAIPGLALRLPGIVGPRCRSNFLSGTLRRLMAHQPVTGYNPDAPFNNIVHVDELASFVADLLGRNWTGFDAITLSASGGLPIRDAIGRLADRVGSRSVIGFAPATRAAFTISNRRAVERYGYAPSTTEALLDRYAGEEMALSGVADAVSLRVEVR